MELLTNTSHDMVGLDAFGLRIVGQRAVPAEHAGEEGKELESA